MKASHTRGLHSCVKNDFENHWVPALLGYGRKALWDSGHLSSVIQKRVTKQARKGRNNADGSKWWQTPEGHVGSGVEPGNSQMKLVETYCTFTETYQKKLLTVFYYLDRFTVTVLFVIVYVKGDNIRKQVKSLWVYYSFSVNLKLLNPTSICIVACLEHGGFQHAKVLEPAQIP